MDRYTRQPRRRTAGRRSTERVRVRVHAAGRASTTSRRRRGAGHRRARIFAASAGRTMTSPRGSRSATHGWPGTRADAADQHPNVVTSTAVSAMTYRNDARRVPLLAVPRRALPAVPPRPLPRRCLLHPTASGQPVSTIPAERTLAPAGSPRDAQSLGAGVEGDRRTGHGSGAHAGEPRRARRVGLDRRPGLGQRSPSEKARPNPVRLPM
jgi:hypothetical protein